LSSCFVASLKNNKLDGKKPSFDDERELNYCWIGRESWHAIRNLFNVPFLTLKVRYPAIS